MRTAIVMLVVLLAGCGKNPEQELVGVWRGRIEFKPEYREYVNLEQANSSADMIVLHVNQGGRFRMLRNGRFKTDGAWDLVEGVLTLTPETLAGKPVAEVRADYAKRLPPGADPRFALAWLEDMLLPDRLGVSEDGERLTSIDPEDIEFSTLYFVRDAGSKR